MSLNSPQSPFTKGGRRNRAIMVQFLPLKNQFNELAKIFAMTNKVRTHYEYHRERNKQTLAENGK
jgi:hypothetical protein